MHMPFDCRFDGQRVQLRPSEERTYSIIGPHAREIFTACSPTDAETCRNWFVHRFEFDCGGERVAWLEAAAAAARHTDWDAWVEDGRFRMRMNPLWGVARARPYMPRRRFMRQRDFEREDGYADRDYGYGPRVVTVTPGFAPAVGIPLTFSGGPPEVAEIPAEPAETPGAMTPQAPTVAAYSTEPPPPPVPDLPERAPPQALRHAAPAPVVAPAPKPATKDEVTDDPSQGPPLSKTPDAGASGGAPAPQKAGELTILNAPRASGAMPAPTTAQSASAAARIETSAVSAPTAMGAQPTAPTAALGSEQIAQAATPEPEGSGSAPPRGAAMPALSPEIVIAAAATATLALAGLIFFGARHWRPRQSLAPPANRDIADISLAGGHRALPPAPNAAEAPPGPPAAEAPAPQAGEGARELPMPTTYAEALRILGASADASTDAIKKIVDGLRLSWHPDLARSEADRLQREARVRQINVAWDIVAQYRSAA
jgi:hypothetical protein